MSLRWRDRKRIWTFGGEIVVSGHSKIKKDVAEKQSHGKMDSGSILDISILGLIYLIAVCLKTPVSTQTIYGRMIGRLLVWKACGCGSSCRYYPNIRTEGRKAKKLAGLGAEVWKLDLTHTLIGLVSPGGNTEQSVK